MDSRSLLATRSEPRSKAELFPPCRAIVAVITSRADLARASRLRRAPDFFEIRLDLLFDSLGKIEPLLDSLGARLIFTTRHPDEGGAAGLSAGTRRDLLQRFLPRANYLDIELAFAKNFQLLLARARARNTRVIISQHNLRDTPSLGAMRRSLRAAQQLGADIFKIATRTDNREQLVRLISFFEENCASFPIAAMGLGKLGAASRREFFRRGSVLNYAALRDAVAPGQLSLTQLRQIRAAYI